MQSQVQTSRFQLCHWSLCYFYSFGAIVMVCQSYSQNLQQRGTALYLSRQVFSCKAVEFTSTNFWSSPKSQVPIFSGIAREATVWNKSCSQVLILNERSKNVERYAFKKWSISRRRCALTDPVLSNFRSVRKKSLDWGQ